MSLPLPPDDPNRDSPQRWCLPGSRHHHIARSAPLTDAVDHFRRRPDTRILPVLGSGGRVIGAIFEEDVRALLFNPFGHALLQNPSFGRSLEPLLKPCPTAAIEAPIADLLDIYAHADSDEGLILTEGERLAGVILNRTLVRLAARQEAARARDREARLARMTASSEAFEAKAAALADLLAGIADNIPEAASTATTRAARSTERASAIAVTARRTNDEIDLLAGQSRALDQALGQLRGETAQARETAVNAVAAALRGSERAEELMTAAQSIESMLDLIRALASKVNLLALNATIEAARAGEAGRGFAIVAGEVKQLAGQTRSAASAIAVKVETILATIGEVASRQESIREVVATVDLIARSVDATVTQQRGLTAQVVESAEAARSAAHAIAEALEEIDGETRHAQTGSHRMGVMAGHLADNSALLRSAVTRFVGEMHAA